VTSRRFTARVFAPDEIRSLSLPDVLELKKELEKMPPVFELSKNKWGV
jgi:hypothetical protein